MAPRWMSRAWFWVAESDRSSGARREGGRIRRGFPRGFCAEPLERRVLLSTVTWVNTSGGDWNTASNWSTNSVPGASDDAVISVSGGNTVTFSSGSASVHSITSASPLTLSGGTLTAGGTVQVTNTFTINGGTLVGGAVNAGSGGQGITAGSSTHSVLDGAAVNTGLDLSAASAFLGIKDGLTLVGTATVSGTGAILDFENTETMTGGTVSLRNGGALDVESGATVTLGSGVTVHGSGAIGQLDLTLGGRALVNQGTISADISGESLKVETNIASRPLAFTNTGTVQALSGGAMSVDPNNYSGSTCSSSGSSASTGAAQR